MTPTKDLPLVYAELLTNIRQVSVIAAFGTPCSATTQAGLSGDGKQFLLRHDGRTTVLNLPGEVVPLVLPSPPSDSLEHSWRLPLAGTYHQPDVSQSQSNEGPWTARTLSQDSQFSCLQCGATIIEGRSIQSWRDLPSENWAEMMDFWHCHKPSEHEHHKPTGSVAHDGTGSTPDLTTSKGYGASTKFSARDGIAFVDFTSFLVSENNVVGAKPLSTKTNGNFKPEQQKSSQTQLDSLVCNTCDHILGYKDTQSEGYKIWKWKVLRKDEPQPRPISWPNAVSIPTIVSSLLCSVISSQGSSKVILTPSIFATGITENQDSLLEPASSSLGASSEIQPACVTSHQKGVDCLSFWVLSPALRYSSSRQIQGSSGSDQCSPTAHIFGTPAMKIFWKKVSLETAKSLAEKLEVEEIFLPAEVIDSVTAALSESSRLLPESGRTFQEWDVGLLDRYETDSN